jgi:hypothetical protein
MTPRIARTYVLSFAAAALALGLLLAGFIWAVDPYLLGGRPRTEGFNAVKPLVGGHAEAAKTRLAIARQPDLLIVGNSRVGIGFDPAALPLRSANLGIPGGTAGSVSGRAIEVAEAAPVKHILVGIDYIDSARVLPKLGSDDTAWAAAIGRLRDWSATRVSLSALEDSVATLAAQTRSMRDDMTDGGLDILGSYDAYYASIGQYGIFEAYYRKIASRMAERPKPAPDLPAVTYERTQLAKLAAFAKARGIRLTFFIYPVHTDVLGALELTGHWPAYLAWQRDMAGFVAALNAEHGTDWALWDATAFAGPSAEAVPKADDRTTRMRWWIESGHFRPELGQELAGQMLGATPTGPAVRIADAAAHSAQLDAAARAYWAQHPAQLARLRSWMD